MSEKTTMAAYLREQGVAFPVTLILTNNTPRKLVEGETRTAIPSYEKATVTFKSMDSLVRAESNLLALERMNQMTDAYPMELVVPVKAELETAGEASGDSESGSESSTNTVATDDAPADQSDQGAEVATGQDSAPASTGRKKKASQ